MKFTIKVNNPSHSFKNALLALDGREYATRAEACEAIYDRMNDRICEFGLDEMPMEKFEAGSDDDYFMDHYLSACRAYILREGRAEYDSVTATVEEAVMTFDEICKGEPVEIVETLADGEALTASCWTDDAGMLDEAAFFDLRASWGDLGRYDGAHGELDGAIRNLCKAIGERFGGCWSLSNDHMISQI